MRRLARLLACLLFPGCVLAVDGYVPLDQALGDGRLAGIWEHDGGRDRAAIHFDGDAGYEIEYQDSEGRHGRFNAVLGRLGDRLVLDVWPGATRDQASDVYKGSLIPGHVLLVLEVGPDTVRVRAMDPDSLRGAIEAGGVRLAYVRKDETVILTGTAAALQAALPAHLTRPGALSDADLWRRVP